MAEDKDLEVEERAENEGRAEDEELNAHRSREIRPIVVVDLDQMRELDEKIENFYSTMQKGQRALNGSSGFRVVYRSGDVLQFKSVERLGKLENSSSDPIDRIDIGGVGISRVSATVSIDAQSYGNKGAKIELRGPPNETSVLASDLQALLTREPPTKHLIARQRPFVISLGIVAILMALIFTAPAVREFSRMVSPILLLSLLPISFILSGIISVFIERYTEKYIGKAVFDWGDGQVRFERNLTIYNYILFTVPAAFVLRLLFSAL